MMRVLFSKARQKNGRRFRMGGLELLLCIDLSCPPHGNDPPAPAAARQPGAPGLSQGVSSAISFRGDDSPAETASRLPPRVLRVFPVRGTA